VRDGVADLMRERALPAASILTPNHFELDCLSGASSSNIGAVRNALAALHARGPRVILVTSLQIDDTPDDAVDVLVSQDGALSRLRTPRQPIKVNGAGDAMAGLFLAHWLRTRDANAAISRAASSVYGVIAATARAQSRELAIIAAQEEFVRPSRLFTAEPV
jgi:pyridoxine kinase